MVEGTIIGSVATGILGLFGMCIAKSKCITKSNGKQYQTCGFTDKPIVDDYEGDMKVLEINNVELLYIGRKNDDSETESEK